MIMKIQAFNFNTNFGAQSSVKIYDKTAKTQVVADVKYTSDGPAIERATLYVKDKPVGYATYSKINNPNEAPAMTREYVAQSPVGCMYIHFMENQDKEHYSQIGTQLHKIVRKRSDEEGYDSKVALCAAHNAHCFHYEMGFRPAVMIEPETRFEHSLNLYNKNADLVIKKGLQESKQTGKHIDTTSLSAVKMIVPKENMYILDKKA